MTRYNSSHCPYDSKFKTVYKKPAHKYVNCKCYSRWYCNHLVVKRQTPFRINFIMEHTQYGQCEGYFFFEQSEGYYYARTSCQVIINCNYYLNEKWTRLENVTYIYHIPELALEESVERENEGKCEMDRNNPNCDGTREFGDVIRLAQVLKNRSCKEVHREKQDSQKEENNPRPLQIHS